MIADLYLNEAYQSQKSDYDYISFLTNAVYENEIIMNRAYISLLESRISINESNTYIHEGAGEAIKNFFTKIKEAISKLIHKVIDFFKNVFGGKSSSSKKVEAAKEKIDNGEITVDDVNKALSKDNNDNTYYQFAHDNGYYMNWIQNCIDFANKEADKAYNDASKEKEAIMSFYSQSDLYKKLYINMENILNSLNLNRTDNYGLISPEKVFIANAKKTTRPQFKSADMMDLSKADDLKKVISSSEQKLKQLESNVTKKLNDLEARLLKSDQFTTDMTSRTDVDTNIKKQADYIGCLCRVCINLILGISKIVKVRENQNASLVLAGSNTPVDQAAKQWKEQ